MPLLRAPAAFDHPDWIFELKHDGFRALAIVEAHHCRFVSRQGHDFWQWPHLAEEVAHAVRATRAVLDGEIVCLRPDGSSDFYSLLFRRERPYFYAFDLLALDGKDLRRLPLTSRKRKLAAIMPTIDTRLRYVDALPGRGRDLFRVVCERNAEGIVAKWSRGPYHTDGRTTSWLKIKNPTYSRAEGRHEVFEPRRSGLWRPASRRLDPAALAAARTARVRA
jgi:bifunctional non-homologous end joining protein LigD